MQNEILQTKERALRLAFEEYKRLSEEVSALGSKYEKLITAGLAVVMAAFLYGAINKINVIYLIVPFAILWIANYNTIILRAVLSVGEYRSALEDKINAEVHANILMWESIIVPRMLRAHGNESYQLEYYLLYTLQ